MISAMEEAMHEAEEQKILPGLGWQKVPDGFRSKLLRITTHDCALKWFSSLSTQQRGELVRAAWDLSGRPTPKR